MAARPACSNGTAVDYDWTDYDARVRAADERLHERTFEPNQSWSEALRLSSQYLALASYGTPAGGDEEAKDEAGRQPVIMRQSCVSLERQHHYEYDFVVSFGHRTLAELRTMSVQQPLSVSLDGPGLMRSLLFKPDAARLHEHYPLLLLRIDVLEADTRGLASPVGLTIQSSFVRGGTTQIRQWCQGQSILAAPSSALVRSSDRDMAAFRAVAARDFFDLGGGGDTAVQGRPVDGHCLLPANAQLTQPRCAYAAPLGFITAPPIRNLLSMDFTIIRNQLSRTQAGAIYRVMLGSEGSLDPQDEAAWLCLHLLHALPNYLATHPDPAYPAATGPDAFLRQNQAKATYADMPIAATDTMVELMEEQCNQHQLCIPHNTEYLRFDLHSLQGHGNWQLTSHTEEVWPSVRVRLTYALVPRSLQSRKA